MNKFEEVIKTREQLREIIEEPSERVTRKVLSKLDKHCNVFIGRCPFMVVSTCDKNGNMDVSPKGDPHGFVKILDEHTLAIPDRLGNKRVDTMENLLQNPKIGLMFVIPGKSETLRISGSASIVRDASLRDSMSVKGRSPDLAIVVNVEEAFFHCSKCVIRSKLWQLDQWPNLDGLPTLAQTMVDAGKLEISENEMHQRVIDDEKERLY